MYSRIIVSFNYFASVVMRHLQWDTQEDRQKKRRRHYSLRLKSPGGLKGGLKEKEEEEEEALPVMMSATTLLWCSMRNKWADFAKRATWEGHEVRVSLWSSAFAGREPPSLGLFRRTGPMKEIHSWFKASRPALKRKKKKCSYVQSSGIWSSYELTVRLSNMVNRLNVPEHHEEQCHCRL